ncbi:hypothetical protein FZ025_13645 [Xanthomonas hyacinthi]|uniref:hypothetical protein n=1 Tax=Xanthomonas hyacinthi TaxID=56455 RepID=UPI00062D9282|nr:hypothetical protein [Xanthomonas hyacinthi]KLD76795.1 hypothetical protein Y886_19300 [Xanthomonas hyacinthi DSM 19077]QGY77631.1 hypothetical protein FZ025_13645 [Xanthomonas hyacinthi]
MKRSNSRFKPNRPHVAIACGLAIMLALSGCASTPNRPLQSSAREAFPDLSQAVSGNEAPAEAMKVAVYEAGFEDVFRVASVSASQAQLNVEQVDKKNGLIFATRDAMLLPGISAYDQPSPHRFFYVISVTELDAKRSQVRVVAKVQAECQNSVEGGNRALLGALSFGMSEIALAPIRHACERITHTRWAQGTWTAALEMGQFQVFMRNNLLAAGLL